MPSPCPLPQAGEGNRPVTAAGRADLRKRALSRPRASASTNSRVAVVPMPSASVLRAASLVFASSLDGSPSTTLSSCSSAYVSPPSGTSCVCGLSACGRGSANAAATSALSTFAASRPMSCCFSTLSLFALAISSSVCPLPSAANSSSARALAFLAARSAMTLRAHLIAHLVDGLRRRRLVLGDAHDDDVVRRELDRIGVVVLHEHGVRKRRLEHVRIGRDAGAAGAREEIGLLHGEAEFLRRRFERRRILIRKVGQSAGLFGVDAIAFGRSRIPWRARV